MQSATGQGWLFPSSYDVEQVARMIDEDNTDLKRWLPGA
jgi:hypothetical protein